jgi:hypothetical protein
VWSYDLDPGPETAYYDFFYGLCGEAASVRVPVSFLSALPSDVERRRVIETEIGRIRAEAERLHARRRN